jgi:hypothetical protein
MNRRLSALPVLLLSTALACSSGRSGEDADEPAAAGKPVTPAAAEATPAAAASTPAAAPASTPAVAAAAEAPACAAGLVAMSAADLGSAARGKVGKTVVLRAPYRQQWASTTGTGEMPASDRAPASSGCAPGTATVGDDHHRVDVTGQVLCSVRLVEGTVYVVTGTFEGPVAHPAPGGGSTSVAATAICKP